jgi:Uma2 family endonuclease
VPRIAGAHVREQTPFVASAHSLPEPDVSVIRGRVTDHSNHPTARDAILIAELAWSSQRIDRRKASIYAASGVSVYWLLDLLARRLEIRTMPVEGAYQVTRILDEDDGVELPESDVRWAVRDFVP